jgi:ankyrin repeat protein
MERACREAREGNLEYISSISDQELGRLINSTDEDGRTLLHAACSSGSILLFNFLVERGAAKTVNVSDDEVRFDTSVSSHTHHQLRKKRV